MPITKTKTERKQTEGTFRESAEITQVKKSTDAGRRGQLQKGEDTDTQSNGLKAETVGTGSLISAAGGETPNIKKTEWKCSSRINVKDACEAVCEGRYVTGCKGLLL